MGIYPISNVRAARNNISFSGSRVPKPDLATTLKNNSNSIKNTSKSRVISLIAIFSTIITALGAIALSIKSNIEERLNNSKTKTKEDDADYYNNDFNNRKADESLKKNAENQATDELLGLDDNELKQEQISDDDTSENWELSENPYGEQEEPEDEQRPRTLEEIPVVLNSDDFDKNKQEELFEQMKAIVDEQADKAKNLDKDEMLERMLSLANSDEENDDNNIEEQEVTENKKTDKESNSSDKYNANNTLTAQALQSVIYLPRGWIGESLTKKQYKKLKRQEDIQDLLYNIKNLFNPNKVPRKRDYYLGASPSDFYVYRSAGSVID